METEKPSPEKRKDDSHGYIELLCKLLPAQLELIIFHSNVDSAKLPGQTATMRQKAEALVRLIAQTNNGDMRPLKALIRRNGLDSSTLPDRVEIDSNHAIKETEQAQLPAEWENDHKMLCRLLPSQFAKMVFLSGIDSSNIPSDYASLSDRAKGFILELIKDGKTPDDLRNDILKMAPGLAE